MLSAREIENFDVLYIKGKYQFKKQYPRVNTKNNILYAGPVEPMLPIWLKISDIIRNSTRVSTESRRELKKLEERAKNFSYFQENGITHIIILQKYV